MKSAVWFFFLALVFPFLALYWAIIEWNEAREARKCGVSEDEIEAVRENGI